MAMWHSSSASAPNLSIVPASPGAYHPQSSGAYYHPPSPSAFRHQPNSSTYQQRSSPGGYVSPSPAPSLQQLQRSGSGVYHPPNPSPYRHTPHTAPYEDSSYRSNHYQPPSPNPGAYYPPSSPLSTPSGTLTRNGGISTGYVAHAEATQIVDLLKRRFCYLSGGRDKRGGPVLTFPTHHEREDIPVSDIVTCVQYLSSIPSDESSAKKYTVLVDNRMAAWKDLRPLSQALQESLGDKVHTVLVVRQEPKLTLSFRRDKATQLLNVEFVTLGKLQQYVRPEQLTQDLGGELPYNHEQWLSNRLELERFVREAKSVSRHLDTMFVRLAEQYDQDEKQAPDPHELLWRYRNLQQSIKDEPVKVLRQGQELYEHLKTEKDSGFRRMSKEDFTQDQALALSQVEHVVSELEGKLDRIQDYWTDRERHLSQRLQRAELEQGMNTVVAWILGPGEKLLASLVEIGDNYKTADEFRKQHEQLELKCTDTYGTYAELRHQAEQLIKDGVGKSDDIVSQRDYMDTVCRSFAARLERRRDLVITSVRYHRLTHELSVMLDELLELVCTEVEATTVESAEAALTQLQRKLDGTNHTADQAFNEGQSLLDQLTLPIKNAFGKDITPDHKPQIHHVQTLLDELQERKMRCDELADVRKLKLQQILQLRICERDAQQAIEWILELYDVMSKGVSETPEQAEIMHEEHQRLQTTAQGTYDYGKQLLQAALVLRRSLRYQLQPNNDMGVRLAEAWKKFSQGLSESAARRNTAIVFSKHSQAVLDDMDKLLLALSRVVNNEMSREELVMSYWDDRQQLSTNYQNTIDMGHDLVHRLNKPIILEEGGEKKIHVDDSGASDQIRGKMGQLRDKMSEIVAHWDEQTAGLSKNSEGQLLGPDGRVIEGYEEDDEVFIQRTYSVSSEVSVEREQTDSVLVQRHQLQLSPDGRKGSPRVQRDSELYTRGEMVASPTPMENLETHQHTLEFYVPVTSEGKMSREYSQNVMGGVPSHDQQVQQQPDEGQPEDRQISITDTFLGQGPGADQWRVIEQRLISSNEWIRVRIQQMEPDLMDVGSTLEEAKALRREHDELLMKLNLKKKKVPTATLR